MNNIINDEPFEIKADELWQKADRMLLVIENINHQGGITTQLMIAAACIELRSFWQYLLNITHSEEKCVKAFPNRSKLEKYIRHFKDAQFDCTCFDDPKQRKEDVETICNWNDEIWSGCYPRLNKYGENIDDLFNSWTEQQTDDYSIRLEMLYDILYVCISDVILELESIIQLVREYNAKKTAKKDSKEQHEPAHNFREFIADKNRTEEIIEKLHRLIDKQMTDTDALKILTRAWWIGWLIQKRPSASSIRAEFSRITCADQHISNCFKESKPTKNGKVDEKAIEKIRQEYEAV